MADMQMTVVDGKIVITVAGVDLIAPFVAAASAEADRAELAADGVAAAEAQALVYASQAIAAAGDGYFYDPVRRTRYKYGVVSDKVQPVIYPHIFLDPENGNDAWDGSCGYRKGATTAGPKKTRAGVEAHAAFLANVSTGCGVTIAIIASDTLPWRDGFDYYDPNTRNGGRRIGKISLVVYGGRYRKITCCDIVPKGSITAHATIPNAYQYTFTPDVHTGGSNQFRLFFNGEPPVRKANQSDCSAANTYWYSSPYTDGTPLTLVFHIDGDADPRSTGTLEVTARDYAFGAGSANYVEGIHGYGNVANNGSLSVYNDTIVKRCIWEEGHKHNVVYGPGAAMIDTVILNTQNSTDYGVIGNMLVCFTDVAAGRNADFIRTYWINDPAGAGYVHSDAGIGCAQHFYSHSGDGGTRNIRFTDCAWTGGVSAMAGENTSTEFYNCAWFGLPLSSGTAQLFVPVSAAYPVTIRGGISIGKFSRLVDSNHLDIEGHVVISAQASTIANGGGAGSSLRLKNNLFSMPGLNITDWALSTTGTIEITGNVFAGFYYAHNFTGAVDPLSITIDRNFYDWTYIGATGGAHIASYKGTTYGTLAAWKAAPAGQDAHSAEGNGSGTMWLSGVNPNVTTADIRISPASAAATVATATITQDSVNACLARPRTYAAGIAYVKRVADATAVSDGMA